jgi:mRNA interferase YafQ
LFVLCYTNRFAKDLKFTQKRGKNIEKLKFIIATLSQGEKLPMQMLDHQLIGNYKDRRECNIEPDWLLIYKIIEIRKEIIFERIGSHSDLFKC